MLNIANLNVLPAAGRPPARRDGSTSTGTGCYHCGEPCPDDTIARGGKSFCCQGCLVVHELLTESGLGHFYDLSHSPGVRVRNPTRPDAWSYLDAPELQRRLLDFTDGKQSRVTFRVPAIHCIACVWLLENLFRLHPGIGHSQVNFPRREVAISFATEKIKLGELVALLASIGYEPSLTLDELDKRAANPVRKRRWLQIGIAGFAFGNIMLFSLPQYFGLDSFSAPAFKALFGWMSLALALPVVVFSASDYWKSALLSLRQRMLTLDVPIVMGLAAIYGQSAFEIISGRGGGYCDSLTGLIFLLLCGRVFQHMTHERLAFDRDYKSFFPLSVTRKSGAGRPLPDALANAEDGAHEVTRPTDDERVFVSQLQVGDRILIRNRELIPADAKLVSGPAFIDYSFVTGESEPVEKKEGDYLYAGGQQIGAAIELEMVKPVSQGYLTSLWSHEAFQKNRDENFNTLTNRYSRRFTLIVVAVAVGAAIWWLVAGNPERALKAFASVLIVACPCALALAAPFTLGTAQRWLARINVFLKSAGTLERLAHADTVVFDKTGTLTSTAANAVAFHGASLTGLEENLIFSLTRHSTHPHSVRICESFGGTYFPEPVWSFLETPGCGVEGQVQGREIWLGSAAWLESRGARRAAFTPLHGSAANETSEQSETPRPSMAKRPEGRVPAATGCTVHLAIDGRYRGAFSLSSTIRPETDRLMRRLAERYELALLSGDNERERERFQALFGDNARLHFNQSPLDKLGFIRRLQESGKTVVMVGDGLNDAGALKQSDVGVAVVENIGAFSPASDVILAANCVPRLGEILALARRATRIVRWSFGISALYNVVGVSIAAAGILSPVVCAILMPLSSATVVLFACGMTTWAARRVAQVSQPAVSPISKSAGPTNCLSGSTSSIAAGWETRDPADLEVCATREVAS